MSIGWLVVGVVIGLPLGMGLCAMLSMPQRERCDTCERRPVSPQTFHASDDEAGAEAHHSHPCARGDDDPACALRRVL